jgi:hypothetical protein
VDSTTLEPEHVEALTPSVHPWTPRIFPCDHLQKGDVVSAETLDRYVLAKRDTTLYRFRTMKIQAWISARLGDLGRPVVVRSKGNTLEILTDAQASPYLHDQFKQGADKVLRSYQRAGDVDVANLTDDQRKDHERSLYVQGMYVGAIQGVREQLRLEAHKRTTPTLTNG